MPGRIEPRGRDRWWIGLLWIGPWLVGFLAFVALPAALCLWYSLCDYPLLEPPISIGLENYRELLADPVFGTALWNTVLYAGVAVPAGTALALGLALLLDRPGRAARLGQAVVFAPALVPVAAAAVIWLWLYNGDLGLVNQVLRPLLGAAGREAPNWLSQRGWAMAALIFMGLWVVGPAVVIFGVALRQVPPELHQAALLEGAGPLRRLAHVTIPMISPVLLFNLVVALIGSFQVFAVPYIMTQGGPDRSTYFYSMYVYDAAFVYGRMGYASAMALMQLLIILGLTGLLLRAARGLVFERSGP
jgi:multiple sugar transport system permease protein